MASLWRLYHLPNILAWLLISNNSEHIGNISKKANFTRAVICRNTSSCPQKVKAVAYTSFVRPELEYASTVWCPHAANNISRLVSVQRHATQSAMNDWNRPHSQATPSSRSTMRSPTIMMQQLWCIKFFAVVLWYRHQSTSLQTCRAWEDIAADTAFQLDLLMPSDTASFLQRFEYGITCHLLWSCLLSSRCPIFDRQVSCSRGGQIRFILFLSAHFARFYQFCSWSSTVVSVTSCTFAMYHIMHSKGTYRAA